MDAHYLDCQTCQTLWILYPQVFITDAREQQMSNWLLLNGWRRTAEGGWSCPDCTTPAAQEMSQWT